MLENANFNAHEKEKTEIPQQEEEKLDEDAEDDKRMIYRLEKEIKLKEEEKSKKFSRMPITRASSKKLTQIKKLGGDSNALRESQRSKKGAKGAPKKEEKKKEKPKDADENEE